MSDTTKEVCKGQAVGVPYRLLLSSGVDLSIKDAPGRYVIMIYGEEYLLDDIVREWDDLKQKAARDE